MLLKMDVSLWEMAPGGGLGQRCAGLAQVSELGA